jgi:outer membrane protein OmpA-like peptidoglycan-associated protein
VEISEPITFAPTREALEPPAFPILAEVAKALEPEKRLLEVVARVEVSEMADEAEALRLSEARARGVIDYLRDKGVRGEILVPRGAGLARPGQPLLELRAAAQKQPRTQLRHKPGAIASQGGQP